MLRIEMKDVAVRKVLQRRCVSANPINFPSFSTTFYFPSPITSSPDEWFDNFGCKTQCRDASKKEEKTATTCRIIACGRKQQYLCVYALTVVILNVLIR
jgi:hypothetical protein